MILHAPFEITPHLMAGVRIGTAWLSIGYQKQRSPDGRTQYQVFIDLPDGSEHVVTDMQSGCQGGNLQSGMASLLSFLGAAGEAYAHRMYTGEPDEDSNEKLFPPAVVEWAYQNSDELSLLGLEIEEPREGEDEIPVLIEE